MNLSSGFLIRPPIPMANSQIDRGLQQNHLINDGGFGFAPPMSTHPQPQPFGIQHGGQGANMATLTIFPTLGSQQLLGQQGGQHLLGAAVAGSVAAHQTNPSTQMQRQRPRDANQQRRQAPPQMQNIMYRPWYGPIPPFNARPMYGNDHHPHISNKPNIAPQQINSLPPAHPQPSLQSVPTSQAPPQMASIHSTIRAKQSSSHPPLSQLQPQSHVNSMSAPVSPPHRPHSQSNPPPPRFLQSTSFSTSSSSSALSSRLSAFAAPFVPELDDDGTQSEPPGPGRPFSGRKTHYPGMDAHWEDDALSRMMSSLDLARPNFTFSARRCKKNDTASEGGEADTDSLCFSDDDTASNSSSSSVEILIKGGASALPLFLTGGRSSPLSIGDTRRNNHGCTGAARSLSESPPLSRVSRGRQIANFRQSKWPLKQRSLTSTDAKLLIDAAAAFGRARGRSPESIVERVGRRSPESSSVKTGEEESTVKDGWQDNDTEEGCVTPKASPSRSEVGSLGWGSGSSSRMSTSNLKRQASKSLLANSFEAPPTILPVFPAISFGADNGWSPSRQSDASRGDLEQQRGGSYGDALSAPFFGMMQDRLHRQNRTPMKLMDSRSGSEDSGIVVSPYQGPVQGFSYGSQGEPLFPLHHLGIGNMFGEGAMPPMPSQVSMMHPYTNGGNKGALSAFMSNGSGLPPRPHFIPASSSNPYAPVMFYPPGPYGNQGSGGGSRPSGIRHHHSMSSIPKAPMAFLPPPYLPSPSIIPTVEGMSAPLRETTKAISPASSLNATSEFVQSKPLITATSLPKRPEPFAGAFEEAKRAAFSQEHGKRTSQVAGGKTRHSASAEKLSDAVKHKGHGKKDRNGSASAPSTPSSSSSVNMIPSWDDATTIMTELKGAWAAGAPKVLHIPVSKGVGGKISPPSAAGTGLPEAAAAREGATDTGNASIAGGKGRSDNSTRRNAPAWAAIVAGTVGGGSSAKGSNRGDVGAVAPTKGAARGKGWKGQRTLSRPPTCLEQARVKQPAIKESNA
ncbi:hypothetical protein BC829DRAFT_406186 [Chytridium lagenaria]|nr:hypothetical protein BC829DRAFT_406186 [Chytridium lagenaria]